MAAVDAVGAKSEPLSVVDVAGRRNITKSWGL
jgi:hypothetical protein